MDEELKHRICQAYDIPVSITDLPSNEIGMRMNLVRKILIQHPPPKGKGHHLLNTGSDSDNWIKLEDPFLVGSDGINNLILNESYISKQHCVIQLHQNRWKLIDQSSKNGVFINSSKVKEKFLVDGDIIQLGDSTLLYVEDQD